MPRRGLWPAARSRLNPWAGTRPSCVQDGIQAVESRPGRPSPGPRCPPRARHRFTVYPERFRIAYALRERREPAQDLRRGPKGLATYWARAPIILTSRASSVQSRIASCALALLYTRRVAAARNANEPAVHTDQLARSRA